MLKAFSGLILMLLLFLMGAACQSRPRQLPFADLVADPAGYHGRRLCTDGIYLVGFEVSALGASRYERDGFHYLTEPVIWLEGAEVEAGAECLQVQGFSFCPATVCGTFEADGTYGHMGRYRFQISR